MMGYVKHIFTLFTNDDNDDDNDDDDDDNDDDDNNKLGDSADIDKIVKAI